MHTIPNDHAAPAAKKIKNSHKPTQSVSSQPAKRSPSYGSARPNNNGTNPNNINSNNINSHHHGHPPSPANTPPDLPSDFELHTYSDSFLTLYNEDAQIVHMNSFANLNVSNIMSIWLRDPERVRLDTLRDYKTIFRPLPSSSLDSLKRPLQVESKKTPLSPEAVARLAIPDGPPRRWRRMYHSWSSTARSDSGRTMPTIPTIDGRR